MVVLIVIGGTVLALVATSIALATAGQRQTTSTRVPVDDFVVGDLPMICAVSGQPADGLVATESDRGVMQTWWLLFLVGGPFGVVAIFILYVLATRPMHVGGKIPMTHDALESQNRVAGWTGFAWLVPFVALGAGALFLVAPADGRFGLASATAGAGVGLLLVAAVGGLAAMVVLSALQKRRTVQVRVEAGGRWVAFHNVHPAFALAATKQTRERHRARNAARERIED